MPPGVSLEYTAAQLRDMNLSDLKRLAQELGISLAGLEDRESALYTRLMQHAHTVTDD